MIHPLFTQFNEDLGNRLNGGAPATGFEMFGETVIQAVAGVVGAYGTAAVPRAYAETVAHRALPNVLPYRVGTLAAFGFAGGNGRSLTDNAPDVMFTVASNTPVKLGIGKESVTDWAQGTVPLRALGLLSNWPAPRERSKSGQRAAMSVRSHRGGSDRMHRDIRSPAVACTPGLPIVDAHLHERRI